MVSFSGFFVLYYTSYFRESYIAKHCNANLSKNNFAMAYEDMSVGTIVDPIRMYGGRNVPIIYSNTSLILI